MRIVGGKCMLVQQVRNWCVSIGVGILSCAQLPAQEHPVDISFLVADLKYSRQREIKICEIQNGILSVFSGTGFINPGDISIQQEFFKVLSHYSPRGWTIIQHIADPGLKWVLDQAYYWRKKNSLEEIFYDPEFFAESKKTVADKEDLSAYHGFLFVNATLLKADEELAERCPGVVVVDRGTFPFWVDKYKMTALFGRNPALSKYKPKWGLYKKEYTKNLAAQIINDLKCDAFVIKPRGAFMGNGVAIVEKDQLDHALEYIINPSEAAKNDPDSAFRYWAQDRFNSFIVEEFVMSDLVYAPHLGNKIYHPTMRVAFMLIHEKGEYKVHFLGGYWKTPAYALADEGTFIQKHKDICKPPYYLGIDSETWADVQQQLRVALPLLHQEMLKGF